MYSDNGVFRGWSPGRYASESDPHKRSYWRALWEHVRSLPESELEMPVYVYRNGTLVLLPVAEPAPIVDAVVEVAAIQESEVSQ